MHLFNHSPTPSGLRCCYWSPDYVAPTPFCNSSKLSDSEKQILSDFEELKYSELLAEINGGLEINPHALQAGGFRNEAAVFEEKSSRFIDFKKAVDLYFSGPKKFYPVLNLFLKKGQKGFGLYNIQTIAGVPAKSRQKHKINRSDFLTR